MKKTLQKKIIHKAKKHSWMFTSFIIVGVFIFILSLSSSQNLLKYVSLKVSQFATVISSTLVTETNSYRANNNETSLIVNSMLTKAAQMKAEDMAVKSYFSHIGQNGEKPWFWFDKVGYKYSYAGENLAVDFTESEDVTTGWINSAKHKANLLNTNFTEIGIGIATGTYEGHQTTFVVQFFGKPYFETKENNAVITEKITTSKLTSFAPEIAVATQPNLPEGEVLGEVTEKAMQTNENDSQTETLAIIGVSFLVLIVFIIKIFTIVHKRNNVSTN